MMALTAHAPVWVAHAASWSQRSSSTASGRYGSPRPASPLASAWHQTMPKASTKGFSGSASAQARRSPPPSSPPSCSDWARPAGCSSARSSPLWAPSAHRLNAGAREPDLDRELRRRNPAENQARRTHSRTLCSGERVPLRPARLRLTARSAARLTHLAGPAAAVTSCPTSCRPRSPVYYYFAKWRDDGTDQTIHDLLRLQVREMKRRLADPESGGARHAERPRRSRGSCRHDGAGSGEEGARAEARARGGCVEAGQRTRPHDQRPATGPGRQVRRQPAGGRRTRPAWTPPLN